jgi:hypothetical protein
MTWAKVGLILNAVGGAVVALTGYWGLAAGWGGRIVWASTLCRWSWWLGWALLVLGFALQLRDG